MTIKEYKYFEVMKKDCLDFEEDNKDDDIIFEILKQRDNKINNKKYNIIYYIVENNTFNLSGNCQGRRNNIYII